MIYFQFGWGNKYFYFYEVKCFMITFVQNIPSGSSNKHLTYREVTKKFQPVFHHFFMEYFPTPPQWFERRLCYTRSIAASSIGMYVQYLYKGLKIFTAICNFPLLRSTVLLFHYYCFCLSFLVGYMVGLGDRHVQNILIDTNTAELVHIDLGKPFTSNLLHMQCS